MSRLTAYNWIGVYGRELDSSLPEQNVTLPEQNGIALILEN